jgi:hypothetical protein
MLFLCKIISSIWNKFILSCFKTIHIVKEGKQVADKYHIIVDDYNRIELSNRPIGLDANSGFAAILQSTPQYSFNAKKSRTYREIDNNCRINLKENILNKLYLHLIPIVPPTINHSITMRKLITNQHKIGVYEFKLTINYSIIDPKTFANEFYHYIGSDNRFDNIIKTEGLLYNYQHFRKIFIEMISPLLQQSLNKLIADDSTPNNKDATDLVKNWKKMNPYKDRGNNIHDFQLSQIISEYIKIPKYIDISKCIVKLKYYIEDEDNYN